MEYAITKTECDVCGKKTIGSYESLRSVKWTKYKLFKEWESSGHKGIHETEIIVCPKCDGKKGIRHFFYRILKPYHSKNKKVE